ncbi:RNAPII degradation factor [Pseudocyphellaria aurata]|nr:RNAPII degradation factor [Pseudocyphellaria aurata]
MSEVKSRPSAPRGRGSARGGRGNYNARGGRGSSRHVNGDLNPDFAEAPSYEDEGELGQLKRMYATKLSTMKEMFPDWTDEDLVFALQETDGNLENTIERISEGNISQWGEVKKKTKDRSQSKIKDSSTPLGDMTNGSNRAGRGRGGLEGARGGRGRGSERGRGGGRGGRGGPSVNGFRSANDNKGPPEMAPAGDWAASDNTPPKVEAEGNWDQSTETEIATTDSSWEHIAVPDVQSAPTAELPKASSKPDGTRSWASIFNKSAPAPNPPKAPQPPQTHEESVEESIAPPPVMAENDMAALPPPMTPESSGTETPTTPPASDQLPAEPPAEITPSKDELTETNLEQVLDTSGPPASVTAASTVASTVGAADSVAPHASQPQSSSRPPLGGYATTAYKAAGLPGRSASFQRKILEQEEAVVMPGKHAVDRTTVQFGSMGLNGTTEDLDVDSDREEAETRAQPPQHSPIAPRAALPPAPQQQAFPSQPPISEPLPTPRQAPGLPPVSQPITQQPSQPASTEPAPQQSQTNHPYNQFNNRYGPTGQQEASAPAQKAYEPFGQQVQPQQQQHQYEGYPNSQAPAQSQTQAQSHLGSGYSSASNESSSYYTSDNQRNAYQHYYGGNYGQSQQSPQEVGAAQQRIGSAFGTTVGEQGSHHAANQPQQHPQARYGQMGEAPTSGNSTPNPTVPNQQQQSQPQQAHQMLQQQQQQQQQQAQGQGGGQHYPYGHPYYSASPYFSAYMNQVSAHPYGRERPMFDDVRRYDEQYLTHNPQFGYGGSHGGYGGGPFSGGAGGKQGMYGQPHQAYGMSPQQTSYDQHSSSPANVGGFAQQQSAPSRDGPASGSLASYGRSGSAQPTENQQQYSGSSVGGYGNMPDVFTRSASGFPGQAQGVNHQVGGQSGTNDDARGGYGDTAKVPGGPSPALGQPGGRPGSAVNSMQGQTGLPPPQSQNQQGQQGYGGYPGLVNHQMQQHGQQGSQYGAGPPGGGLGGHHGSAGQQTHQGGGGYGAYGAGTNAFGASYYGGGGNNRGGWGGNYGGH